MDKEKFKAAVKPAGFHKTVEAVKLDGAKLTVEWKSKVGKAKSYTATLGADIVGMDQGSDAFVTAAAKAFSDQWDQYKKTTKKGDKDDD